MKLLSREEELKKVFRYKGSPCNPMFYRPNLLIHSRRVEWLALEIAKFLVEKTGKNIDINLIKEMARFHDDTEIITGDYLSMDKESFSKEKQKEYENDSLKAIDILYNNFGNISDNYDYKDILLTLEEHEGIEFQIVDFADKLDAHLEISHELFAGNKMFAIELSDWGLELRPFFYTKNKLRKIILKISDYLGDDIDFSDSLLELESDFDDYKCLDNFRKHSFSRLGENTGYNLYDKWVELHFKYGSENDLNYLVEQLEF